jgi:hypothetical protein
MQGDLVREDEQCAADEPDRTVRVLARTATGDHARPTFDIGTDPCRRAVLRQLPYRSRNTREPVAARPALASRLVYQVVDHACRLGQSAAIDWQRRQHSGRGSRSE